MRGRAHWSSYLHLCSSRLRCQSSASHEGNSKIWIILPPLSLRPWGGEPGVVADSFNPSTQEVWDRHGLHSEFQGNLSYTVRHCLWKSKKRKRKNLWKRDIYCFLRHHFKGQLQRKALLRTFCKMPNVSKQPKQLLLRTRYFVSKQQNFGKHF